MDILYFFNRFKLDHNRVIDEDIDSKPMAINFCATIHYGYRQFIFNV